MCGGKRLMRVFSYTAPPEGELKFPFSSSGAYRREILECRNCGHMVSSHDMDMSDLYQGDYADSAYGKDLMRAFNRIVSLDPSQSDNSGRVKRVLRFANNRFAEANRQDRSPAILDVGSGLCVFLYRMKQAGWACVALDPDRRNVDHAIQAVEVEGVCADFMTAEELGRFDAVSFNKVLEHVSDPAGLLREAASRLGPEGIIYIKVPNARWNLLKQRLLAAAGRRPKMGIWDSYKRVAHYTQPTLLALLDQAGLRPLEVTTARPIQSPVWERYVGHYYQHASPWVLDWRRRTLRSAAFALGLLERWLRMGTIGALSPNIVVLAQTRRAR